MLLLPLSSAIDNGDFDNVGGSGSGGGSGGPAAAAVVAGVDNRDSVQLRWWQGWTMKTAFNGGSGRGI
jgi:hypothetical protein